METIKSVPDAELDPAVASQLAEEDTDLSQSTARELPISCTGCGAFAQTDDPESLGYYDLKAKRVREWLKPSKPRPKTEVAAEEDQVVESVLANLDEAQLQELGLDPGLLRLNDEAASAGGELLLSLDYFHDMLTLRQTVSPEPLCDRCHLLTHEIGNPNKVEMFHPTVDSLRETIEESPHKNNHIYHIIDAADFPMSLIPRLNVLLGDIPLRTKNRRSRSAKYMHDRKTEISFIISRGDLLGPTKEKVDKMMPFLREVLRDALGRIGGRVRLGNVHCVSAKRDWWTRELKNNIWKRGGAGWFVGKVNVGKSRLFETVFPKGMVSQGRKADGTAAASSESPDPESLLESEEPALDDAVDFGDLLPPPRPLEMYPQMPVVSSHPGTTASPIRIPFGNNRGELIDLPGLSRSDLELYVKPEHRNSLIMQKRIVPTQISVQGPRSIILGGGLIRITPKTDDYTLLFYNFTPLKDHLTATDKAVEFQAQTRHVRDIENLSTEEAAEKMRSAGTFKLKYDVTKARAGPLTSKHVGGLSVDRLPFRVLSVDILIEGVGYVEVVAQVRKRDMEDMIAGDAAQDAAENPPAPWSPRHQPEPEMEPEKEISVDPFQQMTDNRIDASKSAKPNSKPTTKPSAVSSRQPQQQPQQVVQQRSRPTKEWPAVEVFTPEGRFVDYRQPINGWLNNKPLVKDIHKKQRPRKSMRGQKKMEKVARRAQADA
jgi:ribosome biogenesis GTPase A